MNEFTIEQEKLNEIVGIINDKHQPNATQADVEAFALNGWDNADEHQEWLNTADAEEIVDWIVSIIWA